jgi:hypothetical protein
MAVTLTPVAKFLNPCGLPAIRRAGFDCRRARKAYNRRRAMTHSRRAAMAKGQKRSNREIKKPKADKKKTPIVAGTVPSAMAKAKPGATPAAGKK